MDYSKLLDGEIFSCKVKATYTEIYVYGGAGEYYKAFSIQKKDYDKIIGYGEKNNKTDNDFIPITLTDETLRFIAYKAGFIDEEGNKIGIVNLNATTSTNNTTLVDKKSYDLSTQNQFAPSEIRPTYNPQQNNDNDIENETIFNPITLLDDTDIVFVKAAAIDCQTVSEEDVEIEDVEIEDVEIKNTNKKDYTKLIWLALGAAALLL